MFWTVFDVLGKIWKALVEHPVYVIDSFPAAVCDNYRIRRGRIYRGEAYRDYQTRKKRYQKLKNRRQEIPHSPAITLIHY